MVVTMKFRGAVPDWSAVRAAERVAASHGFECRTKHFFNNKNEVTLMLADRYLSNGLPDSVIPYWQRLTSRPAYQKAVS